MTIRTCFGLNNNKKRRKRKRATDSESCPPKSPETTTSIDTEKRAHLSNPFLFWGYEGWGAGGVVDPRRGQKPWEEATLEVRFISVATGVEHTSPGGMMEIFLETTDGLLWFFDLVFLWREVFRFLDGSEMFLCLRISRHGWNLFDAFFTKEMGFVVLCVYVLLFGMIISMC